jgi:2-oxoglutarate ferredoxin oxidoreductase subunit delta
VAKTGAKQTTVVVMAERCKECGFCIEFCPRHILHKSRDINRRGYHPVAVSDNDKCSGCKMCSLVCPDFAIYIAFPEDKAETTLEAEHG